MRPPRPATAIEALRAYFIKWSKHDKSLEHYTKTPIDDPPDPPGAPKINQENLDKLNQMEMEWYLHL